MVDTRYFLLDLLLSDHSAQSADIRHSKIFVRALFTFHIYASQKDCKYKHKQHHEKSSNYTFYSEYIWVVGRGHLQWVMVLNTNGAWAFLYAQK